MVQNIHINSSKLSKSRLVVILLNFGSIVILIVKYFTQKEFVFEMKMKIFQTVRKQYAVLGVSSSNQPFNGKVLISLLYLGFIISLQIVYTFQVANGLMEYVDCISSIFSIIVLFISLATIASKKTLLFESIDKIEKLINVWNKNECVSGCEFEKSEAFFLKTNRQVERLSELVFIFEMKIMLHCFMLPKCIASYVTYFTTDLRNDAFQLSFIIW